MLQKQPDREICLHDCEIVGNIAITRKNQYQMENLRKNLAECKEQIKRVSERVATTPAESDSATLKLTQDIRSIVQTMNADPGVPNAK